VSLDFIRTGPLNTHRCRAFPFALAELLLYYLRSDFFCAGHFQLLSLERTCFISGRNSPTSVSKLPRKKIYSMAFVVPCINTVISCSYFSCQTL